VGMRPSRMTLPNRPWFWIATSIKRKATTHPAPASDAHCVVGHPAKTITGRAPAATNGTRSAQVEFAQPASTSGLLRSASRAPAGRRTRTGMLID
jgi:hypothetical protein